MRVLVKSEWIAGTDRFAVYIYTHDGITGKSSFASIEGSELVFRTAENGEDVEPTFRVPGMILTGLRDELNKLGPFSDSPVDWLRDAVGTRDRLFSLVEKLTDGPTA